MNHKKYISFLFVFIIMLFFIEDSYAQKRGKKKRRTDRTEQNQGREEVDPSSLKEKLAYEIGFGNPTFFGSGGQSQFNLALKPGVAYKIASPVTAGVYIKADYTFANFNGQEFSLLDYGTGIFTRLKIVDVIYARAELAYQNYSYDRFSGALLRKGFVEPMAGLGYTPGLGDWQIGGELLIHLSKDVRDYAGQVYEFWIKANYRF